MKLRVTRCYWQGDNVNSEIIFEVEIVNDLERVEITKAIEQGLKTPHAWVTVESVDEEED